MFWDNSNIYEKLKGHLLDLYYGDLSHPFFQVFFVFHAQVDEEHKDFSKIPNLYDL